MKYYILILGMASTMVLAMEEHTQSVIKQKRKSIIATTNHRIKRQRMLDDPIKQRPSPDDRSYYETVTLPPLLCFSFSDKDIKYTRKLLEAGASPNTKADHYTYMGYEGYTALFSAVENLAVETAELLLTSNANPNVFTMQEKSPLMAACQVECKARDFEKTLKIIRLLLHHRANPNESGYRRPFYNNTPLAHVLSEGPFWYDKAPFRQTSKIMRLLISYGAEVYVRCMGKDRWGFYTRMALEEGKLCNSEDRIEISKLAEQIYYEWHLLCCRQKARTINSPLGIIPRDVLKIIAKKARVYNRKNTEF